MKPTALLALVLVGAAALAVAEHRVSTDSIHSEYEPVSTPGSALDAEDDNAEAASGTTIAGDVRETFDVAQYTYLRVSTPGGETWAAVSKAQVGVGSHVEIQNATRMENFTSSTLKRTFPEIYFGSLNGANQNLPPGHPAIAGQGSPHAVESAAFPADNKLPIRVSRAQGPTGHTIGELYTQSGSLEGQRVRVRGQVTKVTAGVLGKNFIHLSDGSGDAPQHDLVATTQAQTEVNQVVTLEGALRRDVDIGIGYKYPLLIEDASVLP
jgi:hypothetical protein